MEAVEFGRTILSIAWEWRTRTKERQADSAVILPHATALQTAEVLRIVEISAAAGSRHRKLHLPRDRAKRTVSEVPDLSRVIAPLRRMAAAALIVPLRPMAAAAPIAPLRQMVAAALIARLHPTATATAEHARHPRIALVRPPVADLAQRLPPAVEAASMAEAVVFTAVVEAAVPMAVEVAGSEPFGRFWFLMHLS